MIKQKYKKFTNIIVVKDFLFIYQIQYFENPTCGQKCSIDLYLSIIILANYQLKCPNIWIAQKMNFPTIRMFNKYYTLTVSTQLGKLTNYFIELNCPVAPPNQRQSTQSQQKHRAWFGSKSKVVMFTGSNFNKILTRRNITLT